jgi:ribose transport system ATP-binding protein
MGSGRTEMVRAIFGLDPMTGGEVVVTPRGRAPERRTLRSRLLHERLRAGIGYLSEDRKGEGLALTMSLADNITFTNFTACASRGWIRLGEQREQASRWMRAVGVRARTADQPAVTLSGGNQQKVALARLLHQHCDVLLLDEPTRGIDIGSKAQIYEVIARAAAEGKAVLFVSSYLPELFGLCDRLAVMRRGRLSEARPTSEWTPESVLHAAIDVEAAA